MKAADAVAGLTQLYDAQRVVLDAVTVLGLEKVSILDTLGRVLGEDIVAERENPPWDNSAMDGFAVRADDITQEHAIYKPVTLSVIEDVPAGVMPTKTVGPGQAIRIMTGAPIPKGRIRSSRLRTPNIHLIRCGCLRRNLEESNIRPQGEDVKKGDRIIQKGRRSVPARRGCWRFWRSRSCWSISVHGWRFLSTGDELGELG